MLVLAIIIVVANPFLAFSDRTCHLDDIGKGVFWFHCVLGSKETKLGRSNQEASPSAGKRTRVVLVPCCKFKCVPAARSLGVICYDR